MTTANVHVLTSYITLVPWHVTIHSVVLFQTMSFEGWQLHCTLMLVQSFCFQLQQGGEVDNHSINIHRCWFVSKCTNTLKEPTPLQAPPTGIPSWDYTNKQKRDCIHAPDTHLQTWGCSVLLRSSLPPTITSHPGRLVGMSIWVQEG